MKRKKKIMLSGIFAVVVLAAVSVTMLLRPKKKVDSAQQFHVVILDSEEYYYSDEGIERGIRLALEDLEKENGIKIQIELLDDGGDYVNGISMAKALAEDDTVDAVISFQNFESIGAEVEFFETEKKPFIVTMGCYDEVAENGYQYLLTDFLSGKTIGKRIGQYLEENGRKNIALCHSDTTFEKDEIRGLQEAIQNHERISIFHSQTGPFDDSGLAQLLVKCERLQIDTLVANFYSQTDSAWLLSQIRQKNPDMTLIGDYALDSSEILEEYGEQLEGVMIVPVYPYQESDGMTEFIHRYESATSAKFSTAAVQYYDLFQMLGKAYDECKDSSAKMMDWLKNENGYEGVAGTISFDKNGRLVSDSCPVFICKNKKFVRVG